MNSKCSTTLSAEKLLSGADAGTLSGGIRELEAKAETNATKAKLNYACVTEIEECEEFRGTPDLTARTALGIAANRFGLATDYKQKKRVRLRQRGSALTQCKPG